MESLGSMVYLIGKVNEDSEGSIWSIIGNDTVSWGKDDEPFNKLEDAFEILDTIYFTISMITPEKL